jgi:dihydroxyacid dehydratase/phosphogluconate dehydratase
VSDEELHQRALRNSAKDNDTAQKQITGYLAKYAKLATSADTGGVLRWD